MTTLFRPRYNAAVLAIALFSSLTMCKAATIVYSDGIHNITTLVASSVDSPVISATGTATVNIPTGGRVEQHKSSDATGMTGEGHSSINVNGGFILTEGSAGVANGRFAVRLTDDASITVSSGFVGAGGSGISIPRTTIQLEGRSRATITGGYIQAGGSGPGATNSFHPIVALDQSTVLITGGEFYAQPPLNTGLKSTMLTAGNTAVITVRGSDFNYPNGPLGPLTGTITGRLDDGHVISWVFQRDASATIRLVPEPSTLALAALGAIALMVYRRRR